MPPTITDDTFTIAVINDTQHYVDLDNGIFETMTQWVADNRDTYNIETFWHGGDIVEDYNDEPAEWDIALNAIETITATGITPLLATGNHDIGTSSTRDRNLTEFHDRFGMSWYSNLLDSDPTVIEYGTYEGGSENIYIVQECNGYQFVWVTVEYMPRDGVMDWVKSVFDNHPNKMGAYLCHAYIDYNGNLGSDTDYIDVSDANSAQSQWDGWVSKTENVEMEIGGHYHDTADFNDRLLQTRDDGGSLMAQHHSYQSADANGGNGWLRLLTVDTSTGSVEATTYSPYLDQWDDSAETQYSFDVQLSAFNWTDGTAYFSEDGSSWTEADVYLSEDGSSWTDAEGSVGN